MSRDDKLRDRASRHRAHFPQSVGHGNAELDITFSETLGQRRNGGGTERNKNR
jgi:hypothetical protein